LTGCGPFRGGPGVLAEAVAVAVADVDAEECDVATADELRRVVVWGGEPEPLGALPPGIWPPKAAPALSVRATSLAACGGCKWVRTYGRE
jgi:hypothetical protein